MHSCLFDHFAVQIQKVEMPGRARRSRPNASIEELDDSEDEQQEQAAQRGGAASRRRSNRGMPELTFGFHFLT